MKERIILYLDATKVWCPIGKCTDVPFSATFAEIAEEANKMARLYEKRDGYKKVCWSVYDIDSEKETRDKAEF